MKNPSGKKGTRILACWLLGVGLITSATALAITAKQVTIEGWPQPPLDYSRPDARLAGHPILGRMACPALTRLNILAQTSEPFLLDSVKESADGKGAVWSLTLKKGLTWWSGAAVTGEELSQFLEGSMKEVVARASQGQWSVPKFAVSASGTTATVKWQEKPRFGPYVLSGVPFARNKGDDFECAGPYRLKHEAASIVLEAASKSSAQVARIELSETDSAKENTSTGAALSFQFSDQFSGNPWHRMPADKAECTRPVDMPLVTMITWNLRQPHTASADFRKALTHLTPRGALLRAGAAHLGDLLSGPFLRAHPGYNKAVSVRSFDYRAAQAILEKAGYRRPKASGPRLTPEGKPLELRLFAARGGDNLVAKVIADSFSAVGIKTHFVTEQSDKEPVDGVLTGVFLPWPHGNFIQTLHSKAADAFPYWSVRDVELDKLLESYALSLTQKTPDFATLRKIHSRLFELEPFTILVQHRACLVATKGIQGELPRVIIRNPDWFYDLMNGSAH